MMKLNSLLYGPHEVQDLSESSGSITSRHLFTGSTPRLSCSATRNALAPLWVRQQVCHKPVAATVHRRSPSPEPIVQPSCFGIPLMASESMDSEGSMKGTGFSPVRGSNPPLGMSRVSTFSAYIKFSAGRVKRLAPHKRRENQLLPNYGS